MVWKFFDERSRKMVSGSGIENGKLAEELHEPILET